MTRTFWLSFSDEHEHLGCCVVDVTEEDVKATIARHPLPVTAKAGAEWFAAAIDQAWLHKCNPGGAIAMQEIGPGAPVPRNKLLIGKELQRWTEPPVRH